MRIGTLSESLEDYLETIFRLLQKQKVARVRDIAKAKNVKTSSVVSALKRLSREGMVKYHAREYVDLTGMGRGLAFRLYQRHTFLKRFLVDVLQVDPETAEEDACSMEHHISVTTLDRITALSEFLSYCPQVDNSLIHRFRDRWLHHLYMEEGADSEELQQFVEKRGEEDQITMLAALARNEGGYVARILAEGDLRRGLIRKGVLPGTSVHVIEHTLNGGMAVHLAGERIQLDQEECASVQIWPQQWSDDATVNGNRRTLADITPGNSFEVRKITASGEIRQRLLDMGFIRGARGKILREALLKDPIEIELNETLLSLRRVEATGIIVEEVDA